MPVITKGYVEIKHLIVICDLKMGTYIAGQHWVHIKIEKEIEMRQHWR